MINTPVSRTEKYYITTRSENITCYTVPPVLYIYFLQQYKHRKNFKFVFPFFGKRQNLKIHKAQN